MVPLRGGCQGGEGGLEVMPCETSLKGPVILSWETWDSCPIFMDDHGETNILGVASGSRP